MKIGEEGGGSNLWWGIFSASWDLWTWLYPPKPWKLGKQGKQVSKDTTGESLEGQRTRFLPFGSAVAFALPLLVGVNSPPLSDST